MDTKQIAAILAPVILVAVMVPIFQALSRKYGKQSGWFIGLAIYWIIWGAFFSSTILGKETVKALVRPQKLEVKALLLTTIPMFLAAFGRFVMGIEYKKTSRWVYFGYLATAFGNGFFEEILWRGVYLVLFPGSIMFQTIWPSIWFGIWHYAPGLVSSRGRVWNLMGGAVLLGLFLGFLARGTNTIWYSIIAHTLTAIIMVI
ncbi:MAG: CPBP family intramembrane metalloprotease [Anaerolineales bacterium]|nr:CPBP family intramembrane metalloprotease [Anaerolineales bacterium]